MKRSLHMDPCSSDFLLVHARDKDFSIMGQVKEISLSGASYEYIDDGSAHPEFVRIDIFSPYGRFRLKGIQARLIDDAPSIGEVPFSRIPTRRCSIEFLEMTEEQQKKLSAFLSMMILTLMSKNRRTTGSWR